MNIYNKNKQHWSQVQMMGCLHMRMLNNVSLHVIAVSIPLSLFGSFVRCFYLAMLFGSFIRCFHLVPNDDKVDQPAVPKVQSVSILGVQKFQRGSKYFC